MRSVLSKSGYIYNVKDSTWIRSGYDGIAYSDGDDVEQRIASIIVTASDISVLSSELRQYCTDWPSIYHLSGTRANILRPFESSLRGDILEIGAGCGAITRYLGECGGDVLALEGSPRRAAVARERTRDLKNVTIVCDNFEQFQYDGRFDVVTLIGVLEYANLYSKAENPTSAMLERAQSFLKPNGKLIIAIENKLGLKYFAGAPEDHVGIHMYGIEGRYRNDQPQTFGRRELAHLIEQAGFTAIDFLAPFPDYKLPMSIVTERGFSSYEFDAVTLIRQSVRLDPQLPAVLAFSPELVWASLAKNGLALDFSNSFLVVATINNTKTLNANALAWHYSTERKKQFCKETFFFAAESGKIDIKSRLLDSSTVWTDKYDLVKLNLPHVADYFCGTLLSQEIFDLFTNDNWCVEDVAKFCERYLGIIAEFAGKVSEANKFRSAGELLPGNFFDAIPQNIIITKDGTPKLIDQEWIINHEVPIGFLIFKTIVLSIESLTRVGVGRNAPASVIGLLAHVFEILGYELPKCDVEKYIRLDAAVYEAVTGKSLDFRQTIESLNFPIAGSYSPWPLLDRDELMKLQAQLKATEAAKANAEQQAYAHLSELMKLQAQLKATEAAKANAEQQAYAHLSELMKLQVQLKATEAAKANAEELAIARFAELNLLRSQIDLHKDDLRTTRAELDRKNKYIGEIHDLKCYKLLAALRLAPNKDVGDA
jgi:2-polyprenyl-3-methyl-5-hydroxy-6-metoxy-1,4-benzoquinol methylase